MADAGIGRRREAERTRRRDLGKHAGDGVSGSIPSDSGHAARGTRIGGVELGQRRHQVVRRPLPSDRVPHRHRLQVATR